MERYWWQVRNWYNFTWCGGDGLVEQAVQRDKISWLFGDEPPRARSRWRSSTPE